MDLDYKNLIEKAAWHIVDAVSAAESKTLPNSYGLSAVSKILHQIYNRGNHKMDEEFILLAKQIMEEYV